VIETAEHRESMLAVTHHRLMTVYPKRTTQTQIANGFQDAGFAAAVFTVQQIERRREADRRRRQIAEIFSLKFYKRHRKANSKARGKEAKKTPGKRKGQRYLPSVTLP
jgi:hypothetical protein